jgi:hypothetical protein
MSETSTYPLRLPRSLLGLQHGLKVDQQAGRLAVEFI